MPDNSRIRQAFFYALISAACLSWPTLAFADAPYERFFVSASDIEKDVLKNAVGVLTVTIPGSFDDIRQHKERGVELGGKKWLVVSNIESIESYTPLDGTFRGSGTLPRPERLQKGDWLCEPLEGPAPSRFQIVNDQGEYAQILYDPLKDLTAWVKPADIPIPSACLFVPEVTKIELYTSESGTFTAAGALNLTDIIPISGWSWTGYKAERIITVRFPIVEKKGQYRRIVYNPLLGSTAWIDFPAMKKVFEPRSVYNMSETYFTETDFKQDEENPICVDLFSLSQAQELYKAPDASAHFDRISPLVPDPGSPSGSNYGYGYIMEIQNGFALVSDIDIVTGEERRIGWIKIRNNDGMLTLWPTASPSY